MPNSREVFPVKSPVTGTGPMGASSSSFARSLSSAPGDPASWFQRAWSITKKHFRQTGVSPSNVAPQLGHVVGTPGAYRALLARHVGHTIAKETPYGTIIGKEHPDSPRKIDAAVAAVLAF
jgi:hypothetical protein